MRRGHVRSCHARQYLKKTNGKCCIAQQTKQARLLKKPYSIEEAVTYLSWLGGPKRAPSDGPPGLKTIWIGIDKFYTSGNKV